MIKSQIDALITKLDPDGSELKSHSLIFNTIFALFHRVENLEKHLDGVIGQLNEVTKWINDREKDKEKK